MAHRCQVCAVMHHPKCLSATGDLGWPVADLVRVVGSGAEVASRMGWSSRNSFPVLLSDVQADRWAVACGYHPEQVWSGWIVAGLSPRDDLFVNGGGWRQSWLHLERLRAEAERVAA